jgi:SAM-dependent methyltransferase
MEAEDQFLQGLLEFQYGEEIENKLKLIAQKVPWALNWPESNTSFWNAEAFMWNHKISKETRDLIQSELSSLTGKNLDLGCGSYSYIPSVGFDISEKMLKFNDNCYQKIIGDLENNLPFTPIFDSVTAIFVLNYVKNYDSLLSEIYRVLKVDGTFIMVISSKINDWQKQKEINCFSHDVWLVTLNKHFKISYYIKHDLWFFMCKKRKPY